MRNSPSEMIRPRYSTEVWLKEHFEGRKKRSSSSNCRERNPWQRPHRICLQLLDGKARGTRLYHDQDTWNPPLNHRWSITQHVILGKNTCLKYGWPLDQHVILRKDT